jgi:RNA polymerase sigma factor for flagellar operon FliA
MAEVVPPVHRVIANYAAQGLGDEATELRKHSAIIDRLARRLVMRTGLESAYDDLWSAGALGLIEAMRRFDGTQGATFETFAEHRVRGAMLDELRRLDHLPRRLRDRTDKLQETKKKLTEVLGRNPTVEEVASEMHLDLEEASSIEALLQAPIALDKVASTLVVEEDADDPIARKQLLQQLTTAIEQIPQRLQLVLQLHYVEGLTYREIAGILQVSEPRICQLHGDAVEKVRALMRV